MGQQLSEKDEQEENLQRRLREMEQQLSAKDKLKENLQSQLRGMEQQLSEKDKREENLQSELREMEQQLREKDEQEENSQSQLREMEQQLREKDEQEENLQRQLREMKQQLREKSKQKGNFQRQLREMEEQLREINKQKDNFQRQLREMEQQLREKNKQKDNFQRQLREMEQQLREKNQQEDNFQRQLRELEQQLTNLQEQYREKEDETVNLQEQVTTQERELRVKDQQVNELEITLSTAQQALSEGQRRYVTPDWVISRDEIQLTDKLLGKGGWGSVVEGKYCGCAVAVKQIHDLILSPHNCDLFEREMDIASRCRHPCLLQFIGATNDERSPLFVTELMESSLRALLEQRPLGTTEVPTISLDVARALNYLHQKTPSPIIHRDISSANVLLWRQGDQWRGKVSDYGTANFMQHTMTVGPGAMIYMAPEALTSKQTVKVSYDSLKVYMTDFLFARLNLLSVLLCTAKITFR